MINEIEKVVLDVLASDTIKAVFSVVFVFFYLNVHLKSFFISTVGISIIIFSFPVTVLITEFVFQVTYFGSMHIVIVYIILGIGADDLFVVYDAW